MFANRNALTSYGRVASADADPLSQVVALYDGAIKFLRLAATDIEGGDLVGKAEHTTRALDIIGYLQGILDFSRGGDVAPTLDKLYASVTAVILRASVALDAGEMRRAAELLTPVRDSWMTIAAAPQIIPTPTVAGIAASPFIGGQAQSHFALKAL